MNSIKILFVGIAFWGLYGFICTIPGALELPDSTYENYKSNFFTWLVFSFPSAALTIVLSLLNSRSENPFTIFELSAISGSLGAGIATYFGGKVHSWESITLLGAALGTASFVMSQVKPPQSRPIKSVR